ncbi:MAG: class I SAM-dependent methyltransferase [Candidatus Woesearchaeota archaeon]
MYPKAQWWMERSLFPEYQLAYDEILKYIPKCNYLLDIGCGTGELLKRVSKSQKARYITGLDISKELLAKAAENLRCCKVNLVYDNILDTKLPKEAFDCVTFTFPAIVAPKSLLTNASPEQVTRALLYKTLANIASLIKKGGTFVQVEFDAYDENPEANARVIYGQLCRQHGLTLQSLKFYQNEKITDVVDIKKEAKYKGYVVIVSKKP